MTTGTIHHLPIETLHHYPQNPRKGNTDAIKHSLTHHGQYKPLIATTSTPHTVLAGNHTLQAMRELNTQATTNNQPAPYTTIPVYLIDVDEAQAAEIVLIDNKTSGQATYNHEALYDLLDWLPDLERTGYTDSDLQDLQNLLAQDEPQPEPQPEPTPTPYDDFITVRLQLPPHLAQQWLTHATHFDSNEEALEHLLDHMTATTPH